MATMLCYINHSFYLFVYSIIYSIVALLLDSLSSFSLGIYGAVHDLFNLIARLSLKFPQHGSESVKQNSKVQF